MRHQRPGNSEVISPRSHRRLICSLMRMMAALSLAAASFTVAAPHAPERDDASKLSQLAMSVERAEDLRSVKNLQIAYAQYSQFGLWNEMASLFTDNGEAIYGKEDIKGRAAIERYYLTEWGSGREGLAPGDVHTQFEVTPVVNLSADGRSAKGRWNEISLLGRYGKTADWAHGIMENEYVKENGVWKIARLHYYPMNAGPYETGWRDVDATVPIVPNHYTSEEAGVPIPALQAEAALSGVKDSSKNNLHSLDLRIAALNDEDKVRNLQNIYGYYMDRMMWDDITDLFAPDGALEVANIGVYDRAQSIRRYLDSIGPENLRHGELNDHLQLDTMIEMAPNGLEARSRGLEWGMLGDANKGTGYWTLAVFENTYVKLNAIWRIREMRIFPLMKADYYQGWAKSHIVDPPPASQFAPDRPTTVSGRGADAVPVFFLPNPATGHAISYPDETKVVGKDHLLPSWAPIAPADDREVGLAEAQRRLSLSTAYDAVENISSAFGETLNDHTWLSMVALFAKKGMRSDLYTGFYVAHKDLIPAETAIWGPDPEVVGPTYTRDSIRVHLRMQPVIYVAPDGRSAKLSTRLLVQPSYKDKAGEWNNGTYPDDQAVLEDGVWKFWSMGIDEKYMTSDGYEGGWPKVKDPPPGFKPRPNRFLKDYPPDIPYSVLGVREEGFNGGPTTPIDWPSIKPFWFFYKNPVSGRLPPLYWPDCETCVYAPSTSMRNNGYTLPPS